MDARFFARLAPRAVVSLALAALALGLPACDCAGNNNPMTTDAGDTGLASDSGPPRDTGPDTGARDTGARDGAADTNTVQVDAGMCSNPETCNGMDDDCDGTTDESIVRACGSDIGICRSGTETCAAGIFGVCSGGMMAAPSDTCGNGLDDDCDESTDESCACVNGTTQGCGSGVGECRRGTQTCASSMWGACAGEVVAVAEICDGLDNNCDGTTDETFAGLGGACDGPDADMCTEGTLMCTADHSGVTCSDATGDTAEACNGTDDNCDGRIDEGCTCTDGATQPCGTDVGACVAGTQTCAGGAWGACAGSTGPTAETCNTIDDNCDGSADEGFVLGTMCDGSDTDMCNEGVTICDATTGGVVCGDATGNSVETCNGTDDNCDGTTDEGFMLGVGCDGPDTDMCNEGTFMCNAGMSACSDATGNSVETCNGMDDDCDGMTDEGNPGGVTTMIGTCVSQTLCMGGVLVSRGTFVSAAGLNTNPGTSAMPLALVTPAIANAVAIGGGADVCVCDPPGGATSTFTDNVTMVEGVSVLGGLDCGAWLANGNSFTAIQDTDVDGLVFPAAITGITALDHMTVVGFNDASVGATTSAVTITDSSPALATDTVRAGGAATAIGLRVVQTAGANAAPTVTNGSYSATGVVGGTAVAVSLESSHPRFTMVTIGGGAAAGAPPASTAYGVRCTDCGGTIIVGGSIGNAGAVTSAFGFHGTGNLVGLAASGGTSFFGGSTTAVGSTGVGLRLDTCTGAPTFTAVTTNGGFSFGAGGPVAMTTHIGVLSSGASCAPVIDGGRHVGCEAGFTCEGIECNTSSPCVVRNATAVQGSTGQVEVAYGMRCITGGCASATASTIGAASLTRTGPTGIALAIDGASPTVDNCRITGPSGGGAALPPLFQGYAVYLRNTSAVLTNNVIHDGSHMQIVADIQFDMTAAGPALRQPTVVNNTLDYLPCTTCGTRVGLVLNGQPGALVGPLGIFRNNIIYNRGAGGVTAPVSERNAQSDPAVFENNALWDPTASSMTLYQDEGTMSLQTGAQINALNGMPAGSTYAMNQVVNCLVNATFHIPMASMCVDTGTNTTCPTNDIDGAGTRPFPVTCDIGADEFRP